ncbi:MAG: hypothetical protein ACMVY4_13580 [Minwuia sp.]|uniref:hypothetical protein n=1 Tax=Minwuia sp. TaxID=2493630 RepID=UPI003A87F32A
MKKVALLAIGLAVIAAGVYFGLPAFADRQFRKALDVHVAARGSDAAGYSDAAYDYWTGAARIGSFRDVVVLPFGDAMLAVSVRIDGLAIDGVDLDALEDATAGDVARSASWTGVVISMGDGAVVATGGAGRMEALSLAGTGGLYGPENIRFATLIQDPLDLVVASDGLSGTGRLGGIEVTDYAGSAIGRFSAGPAALDLQASEGTRENRIAMGWETLVLNGLARGEPATLDSGEHRGMFVDFDVRDADGTPLKGRFAYGAYAVEKARFDERVLGTYAAILKLAGEREGEPSPEETAAAIELVIASLERAVALETGAERFSLNDLAVEMPGVQEQHMDSISGGPVRGLSLTSVETLGQKQTDALGNRTSVRRSVITGVDLNGVPAYLREVLGAPVTAGSLKAAGDFFRTRPLADTVPPFDFGAWHSEDQTISTASSGTFHIERLSMDAMKADGQGNLEMSFSVAGIGVSLDSVPPASPEAVAIFEAMRADGIEEIELDVGVAVRAGLADGLIRVEKLALTADRLADLQFSAEVNGLDFEQLRGMPAEQRSQAMMLAPLSSAGVTLSDRGLRRLMLKVVSGNSGAEADEVAHVLALQAEQIAAGFGSPRAVAIGETVAQFLLSGGEIRLAADITPPVPLLQLMLAAQTAGPGEVLEKMNVTAEHSPQQ